MPNPKTVARVALAAVAVPGALVGIAAPAASAAELAPAAKSVDSHVADAQHQNLSGAQHSATAAATTMASKGKAATPKTDAVGQDLTSQHVLSGHNTINGKNVSLPA